MKTLHLFVVAASSALLAFQPAAADPGNGKPGKGRGHEAREGQSRRAYTRLGDYERRIVVDYYGGKDCPPGLAKKNNGCLPPGIAKKRYEIGRPLGPDVYVREAPYDLVGRLPYLNDGYGYRIVDGDLAVVELATMVVLDAIGLY
jgi:hypothetical protein